MPGRQRRRYAGFLSNLRQLIVSLAMRHPARSSGSRDLPLPAPRPPLPEWLVPAAYRSRSPCPLVCSHTALVTAFARFYCCNQLTFCNSITITDLSTIRQICILNSGPPAESGKSSSALLSGRISFRSNNCNKRGVVDSHPYNRSSQPTSTHDQAFYKFLLMAQHR